VRILVIDDDPDVRDIMAELITSAGHEVVLASNGREGLEAHRACSADIAVVDLFMPEKEGLETIRDFGRDFPDVKVVAMTGGGRWNRVDPYLSTARAIGVAGVLKKPFDAATLLETIDRLTRGPR
jgi:DNA-binding NtrC family response regulator